jgi:hypothetical protein
MSFPKEVPAEWERREGEAFRVMDASGRIYRIYADGRTEGFDQPAMVVNSIPGLIRASAHGTLTRIPTSFAPVPETIA